MNDDEPVNMLPVFLAICGSICIAGMAVLFLQLRSDSKAERDCQEQCTPRQYKIIGNECFCRDAEGWILPEFKNDPSKAFGHKVTAKDVK